MYKVIYGLSTYLLLCIGLGAQPGTDIYVFDLDKEKGQYRLSMPIKLSWPQKDITLPTYENQPSFLPSGEMLYASTVDGQTEIISYGFSYGISGRLTETAGSEYSPQLIPGTKSISAVRLETDGTQLLYSYPMEGGAGEVLVPEIKIGYYCWISPKKYVAFVLGDPPTLRIGKVHSNKTTLIDSNIDRSIYPLSVPNTFSYIKIEENGKRMIYTYDVKRKKATPLVEPLEGSQDLVWLSDDTILMGKGSKLFKWTMNGDKNWMEIADLAKFRLRGITRLAVNQEGNKLAVVVEENK